MDILVNEDANDYGLGSEFTIDTTYPFHVKTEYHERDSLFVGYTTTLTQGDNTVVMTTGDCPYLNELTSTITQMAWTLSHWRDDTLTWLEHGVCTGTCEHDAVNKYQNLAFWTTGAGPAPEPEPQPEPEPEGVVYKYANECTSDSQDKSRCTNDCPCFKSWPEDDPAKWRSTHAACRCLGKQRAPEGYTYNQ